MRKTVLAAIGVGITLGGLALLYGADSPDTDKGVEQGAALEALPPRPPAETFAAVFEPCAHCHQIGEGARVSTGPILTGILGQPIASGDYPYSPAMQSAGIVWDRETLRAFLIALEAVVPGSRMYFGGLTAGQADAVIDFIENPRPDGEG